MRRAALLALATAALVVLPTSPASAHTVRGVGATDFTSRLVSVSPASPGLRVRLVENGARLELTNTSPVEVTVLGYNNEPYLRVGPDGVFRNSNSPATYLNRTPLAAALPAALQRSGALPVPVWQRISSGHSALWHDHRTHWRSPLLPPGVRARPGVAQPVLEWQVRLLRGGEAVTISGTVTWIPSPSPWLLLGGAFVLCVVVVFGARTRWWGPVLGVALAALLVGDAVHAGGVAFDYVGSLGRHLLLIFATSYYSVIAWALGLVGLRMLVRRKVDGLFLSLFSGLVIVVFGGLTDFRVLDRSSAPFALPVAVERGLVALTIGLGAGMVIGSILALRANGVRAESVGAADPVDAVDPIGAEASTA